MRFPPPEVRATWPKPNYIDPERRGPESIILQAILVVFSTAFVLVRLYARVVITRAGIGLDDVLIVLAWITGVGLTSGVLLAIRNYGWDVHVWDLPSSLAVSSRMVSWSCMVLYLVSSSLTKASILVFYLRILVSKRDKLAAKITLGITMLYFIVLFLVLVFQCKPVSHYWAILIPGSEGKCLDEGVHMNIAGVLNVMLDVAIYIIPLRSLFALKIRLSQKLQVISLFSVGLIVIAAASVRIYYNVVVFLKTYDVSWYGYAAWIWCAVEVNLSIMCACVPSCRAFVASWDRFTSKGGSRGPGTYPSAGPGGRSYNYIDEDSRILGSVKLGSMAKVEAGSLRSDGGESKDGVRVQTEVLQVHERGGGGV